MTPEMKALALAIQVKPCQPVMLVGVPGQGKSEVIEALAEAMGYECEILIAPQMQPEDLTGLPVVDHETRTVKFYPIRAAARLAGLGQDTPGIVFIDEYGSTGSDALGAACLTLLSAGRVSDLQLSERIARIAAMNPAECAANGRDLSPPEVNRFLMLDWELSPADFADYMRGGKGALAGISTMRLPDGWDAGLPEMRAQFASFVETHQHLVVTDADKIDGPRPWTSYRSLERLCTLLTAARALGEYDSLYSVLANGLIGLETSAALYEHLAEHANKRETMDLDLIFNNPDGAPLPTDHEILQDGFMRAIDKLERDAEDLSEKETIDQAAKVWNAIAKPFEEHFGSMLPVVTRLGKFQDTYKYKAYAEALHGEKDDMSDGIPGYVRCLHIGLAMGVFRAFNGVDESGNYVEMTDEFIEKHYRKPFGLTHLPSPMGAPADE